MVVQVLVVVVQVEYISACTCGAILVVEVLAVQLLVVVVKKKVGSASAVQEEEGVLKEVKQQGQGKKNATYVVLWVQSDAKNAKIGQVCKMSWEMNIALH